MLRIFSAEDREHEPIVITGIGMITSLGDTRETTWRGVQAGESRVRRLRGIPGIPDDSLIGAVVDIDRPPGRLKSIPLCERATDEALCDARIDWSQVDRTRFGCSISGHMGDPHWLFQQSGVSHEESPDRTPWFDQWLPNTACAEVATKHQLGGPRFCHSTACATSLISFLTAVRAIRDGQCDIAIAAGADAIDPLFAAGFSRMRVLATHDDPRQACRPFDKARTGFVMGEGAAALVVERLSHAVQRDCRIYGEVLGGTMLAEAHHVTDLHQESEALAYLVQETLRKSHLSPSDVGYINAHGTGTEQNDRVEMRGIRRGLGRAADEVCVSSTKSMLGHTVNAAGCVELAITALAMRDGVAPPTINLTDPDPECTFDCVPLVSKANQFQHALKVSVAFGGHLVAVALRRWNDAATGFAYPERRRAA
ncbi:MAG: beta-ketoacyl-[acyl-carrier-protein] synthase family protein [Planctomycetales bacterium]|nr:beta-ketoacyl-[acyl-carrier-protein] synthase family protein [Planctomycetales bacterium]MCA9220109.1 beta-ketoacyl-[acyl-carrier-protein] synthase family protein [Planctomycetales bacterium]